MVDFSLQNMLNLKKNAEQTELLLLNFLTSKWALLHEEIKTMNRIYQGYLVEIEAPATKSADKVQKDSLLGVLQEIDRQRAIKQRQISELHLQINRQTRLISEIRQEVKTLEKILNKKKKSRFFNTAPRPLFFNDKQKIGFLGIKLF